MSASPSALRGLVDIFAAPRDALQAAYDHPRRLWLPLIIVLVAMAAFWLWYYQTIDIGWLRDHFLSMSSRKLTPEQMETARNFMTRTSMTVQTLGIAILFTLAILAIVALYLHIVAKVSGFKELEYGRWFSLLAWSMFPTILVVIGMTLNYGLSGNSRIPPENLPVTNLTNLLGFDITEAGWQRALGSFDIVMLWEIFLSGLGVSMYLKKSLAAGIAIAAVPTVLFYVITVLLAIF